jgi:hypothetical protein
MMRISLLFKTIVVMVLTMFGHAHAQTAQDSVDQNFPASIRLEIEGGLGGTSFGVVELPFITLWGESFSLLLETSLQYYSGLFTFRSLNSYFDLDRKSPQRHQREFSLLFGQATSDTHLFLSGSVGPALLTYRSLGNYLSSDSILFFGRNQFYSNNDQHTIGLAYQCQIMYTTLPDEKGDFGFNIGLTVGGNLSKLQPNVVIVLTTGITLWP